MVSLENLKPSDKVTVLDYQAPISQGAATVNGAWVKASDFNQFRAVLSLGVLAGGATVDFKLQQATTVGGAGAKDITGAAIAQFTQAGGDSGKIAEVNLDPKKLDATNSFDYVRTVLTVAVAAALLSVKLEGFEGRVLPGLGGVAAVAQVVSVF